MFFKHCLSGADADLMQQLHSTESGSVVHNPDTILNFKPSQSHLDYLSSIAVSYPVRNKAKCINSNIINYQFEGDKIKQEVFLLEFDLHELLLQSRA
jgi:hypothetical protein